MPEGQAWYTEHMERALLEMLGSHSAIALAVSDAEGRVTLTTPALERMIGRGVAADLDWEFESLPLYDALGQHRLTQDEMPLTRARRGDIVIDEVCSLGRPDGWTVYLRCSATPLRGPEDQIRGAIVLVQDVTSEWVTTRKQAELRDRLVTTVSHELRTPLTKIIGHAELLSEASDEGVLAAPLARSVAAITRAAQELREMAERLTHLANLDAVTRLNATKTDIVPILRAAVDSQRQVAAAHEVRMDLSTPSELLAVVDGAQVGRATKELVTNALTHAPAGSRVVVSAQVHDGHFEICISDEGPGMPAAERSRLVQPFERGEHDASSSSPGLGLAVVSAIVEAHGGTIALEDNKPHGLVAKLSLRRA